MVWLNKRGRSVIGAIYASSVSGDLYYVARRWHDEIYCCGLPNISAAIAAGLAEWAIDYDDLLELRFRGVKILSIAERERDGAIYAIRLEECFDPAKYKFRNFEDRGGARQHYINLKHFVKQEAKVII